MLLEAIKELKKEHDSLKSEVSGFKLENQKQQTTNDQQQTEILNLKSLPLNQQTEVEKNKKIFAGEWEEISMFVADINLKP
ncbi:MAG: hypothetical protein AABZ32_08535 [Bacteroidota bacterium]